MERLYTFEEAREVLRVSDSMLYKLTATKSIGHLKIGTEGQGGGKLLFRESDLQAWVDAHVVRTGSKEIRRGRPRIRLENSVVGTLRVRKEA